MIIYRITDLFYYNYKHLFLIYQLNINVQKSRICAYLCSIVNNQLRRMDYKWETCFCCKCFLGQI